ncbi:glutamate--tRNA ligase [Umezawaea sp. Da 62-37]|uniref:glutamate--tRNA ligase n=1 Tax=Umezawaea sp. Da 62-37 TaxID=3075927 RepID=UPI0028F72D5F|nr:glutamate--tRNA ligase [Umezawaea sp. Da 62-37]WNV85801.1 glutamate--tRNA ligase [Umezawaea sp. Da 62-37]
MTAAPDPADVRVRFAPNGEIPFAAFFTRTVLYSWLFARRYGGAFVLRFDDTDLDRIQPGALESYVDGMRWLGLDWDEGPDVGGDFGPYRQSERRDLHHAAIDRLLDEGRAYHCYCDRDRLAAVAESARRPGATHLPYDGRCRDLDPAQRRAAVASGVRPAVRLRTPDDGTVVSHDLLRGPVSVSAAGVNDFVLCRPDGWPTYHLTVVVDDAAMRISHVIRGVEGLSNMAPQALVHDALGLPRPHYLHFPLVRTPMFEIGDCFLPRGHGLYLDELRASGYLPGAVLNYYATLGFGYPDDRELLSRNGMVDLFDHRRISRKEFVTQSLDKLRWVNRKHVGAYAPRPEVVEACVEALTARGLPDARDLAERGVDVVRGRSATAVEAADLLLAAHNGPDTPVTATIPPDALRGLADAVHEGQSLTVGIRALAEAHRVAYGDAVRDVVGLIAGPGHPLAPDDLVRVIGPAEAARRIAAGAPR